MKNHNVFAIIKWDGHNRNVSVVELTSNIHFHHPTEHSSKLAMIETSSYT